MTNKLYIVEKVYHTGNTESLKRLPDEATRLPGAGGRPFQELGGSRRPLALPFQHLKKFLALRMLLHLPLPLNKVTGNVFGGGVEELLVFTKL